MDSGSKCNVRGRSDATLRVVPTPASSSSRHDSVIVGTGAEGESVRAATVGDGVIAATVAGVVAAAAGPVVAAVWWWSRCGCVESREHGLVDDGAQVLARDGGGVPETVRRAGCVVVVVFFVVTTTQPSRPGPGGVDGAAALVAAGPVVAS